MSVKFQYRTRPNGITNGVLDLKIKRRGKIVKLIGSKTEQEIRQLLIKSNQLLFKSEEKKRLLEVIKSSYPEMRKVYIFEWVPKQSEDLYKMQINDSIVGEIKLERMI